MSTITMTTSTPAQGSLGKVFAWVGHAWTFHRGRAAFAGLSEREFQDIGWGQLDRQPVELGLQETPPERRARLTAQAAWYGTGRKAA